MVTLSVESKTTSMSRTIHFIFRHSSTFLF